MPESIMKRSDILSCSKALGKTHAHINRNSERLSTIDKHELDVKIPLTRNSAFCLLQECGTRKKLAFCRIVQCLIIYSGLDSIPILGEHLHRLFANYGSLTEANQSFNRIVEPSLYAWTVNISSNAKAGQSKLAIELYKRVQTLGVTCDRFAYLAALKGCTLTLLLLEGRLIHDGAIQNHLHFDIIIGSALVDMYVKCGSLEEAQTALDQIQDRNVVSWGAIMAGYIQHGEALLTLRSFEKMQQEGIKPDRGIFFTLLKAYANLGAIEHGRYIHEVIIAIQFYSDVMMGNNLINMYAQCGSLLEASRAFDNLQDRDVISWSVMIAGYAQHSEISYALELVEKMQQEGIQPDDVMFLSLVKAFGNLTALEHGRVVHHIILESGFQSGAIYNSLIDMYAKCGSLYEACEVFDKLSNRDVVSWSTMIAGYVQHQESSLALECFEEIQQVGLTPTDVTFLCALKACGSIGAIEHGRLIHFQVMKQELQSNTIIGTTLLDMYMKCGSVEEAHKVFVRLSDRSSLAWGMMIAGYAHYEDNSAAVDYFEKMQQKHIQPTSIACLGVLKACASMKSVEHGRLNHSQIMISGFESDALVQSALVDMYAKCGSLTEACVVFGKSSSPDAVLWGAMVAGYAQHGEGQLALKCFENMQRHSVKPTSVTFLSALKACVVLRDVAQGRLVHFQIEREGLQSDVVIGNTLVDMYAKCGSLEDACKVFGGLPRRTPVSWGVMISGYVHHGEGILALECFRKMQEENVLLSSSNYLSVLKACASVGAVEQGRIIHHRIMKDGFGKDITVGNTLVDMYAKCGSMEKAVEVFKTLAERTAVTWSAMVAGYGQHGDGLLALECFEKMQSNGIKPNEASFTSVLISCSHACLIDEGQWYFMSIPNYDWIKPTTIHYTCLVDLLGRVGYLSEAQDLIHAIIHPNVVAWISLLTACRMRGDQELAAYCFNQVTCFDPFAIS